MKVLRLRVAKTLAVIMVVCLGGFVCLGWIKDRDGPSIEDRPFNEALAPQVAQRGAYLVQVGNCAACHTARGGLPFFSAELEFDRRGRQIHALKIPERSL